MASSSRPRRAATKKPAMIVGSETHQDIDEFDQCYEEHQEESDFLSPLDEEASSDPAEETSDELAEEQSDNTSEKPTHETPIVKPKGKGKGKGKIVSSSDSGALKVGGRRSSSKKPDATLKKPGKKFGKRSTGRIAARKSVSDALELLDGDGDGDNGATTEPLVPADMELSIELRTLEKFNKVAQGLELSGPAMVSSADFDDKVKVWLKGPTVNEKWTLRNARDGDDSKVADLHGKWHLDFHDPAQELKKKKLFNVTVTIDKIDALERKDALKVANKFINIAERLPFSINATKQRAAPYFGQVALRLAGLPVKACIPSVSRSIVKTAQEDYIHYQWKAASFAPDGTRNGLLAEGLRIAGVNLNAQVPDLPDNVVVPDFELPPGHESMTTHQLAEEEHAYKAACYITTQLHNKVLTLRGLKAYYATLKQPFVQKGNIIHGPHGGYKLFRHIPHPKVNQQRIFLSYAVNKSIKPVKGSKLKRRKMSGGAPTQDFLDSRT